MTSHAERYRAFRERQDQGRSLAEFEAGLAFPLDPFQRDACAAVQSGHSVLVAAPTGAGKTVVGEFAIRHAHDRGEKAFYTTPIKALSNQKFNDLRAVYGQDNVGLLTGDTVINSRADIVVMTTEVLRNMIYQGSEALDRLGVVVLDEVHYLADRYRGSVWEEVIIHLGPSTALVALSATVSNAEEFGAWLTEVRGDTKVIVSEHRPVPLWPHVLLREGLLDLYAPDVDVSRLGDQPRLNPELDAIAKRQRQVDLAARPNRQNYRPARGGHRPRPRRSPPRFAVVETLDRNALLPAIVFIFSRAGCEGAVDQVRSSGIQLTTQDERAQIEEIVDMRCAGLPPEDLGALGYLHWRDHLAAGIAAHHAGMIPLFKEVVEELFKQGLVKVVYATETLALGINMPARSVVLEKLVKWDGQGHKDLTAGEYTQLTGRAGRRGIDVEGHAVVVEHPGFDSTQLARLASRRTYPLISSFQPSYNMTVNLVASSGVYRARELLELSFAQFQADQGVVGKAARVRELEREIAGFGQAVECDKGDFLEYAALRERIGRTEKRAASTSAQRRRESTASTLANLRQGDVIRIGSGKRAGIAVVVAPDNHRESPRPVVVSEAGRSFRVAVADLHRGVDKVGEVKLPRKADFRNAQSRREIALALQRAAHEFSTSREAQVTQGGSSSRETEALRRQLRAHPCHGCPDRENHARWAERYFQALRKRDAMVGEISKATGSIARIFERRCGVLTDLGYLEGEGDELTVTEAGQSMRGLYAENDLVVTECMRTGAWAGLNGPGLAAVCSAVLYQGRREDETRSPKMPGGNHGPIAQAIDNTVRVWSELDDLHAERGLPALPAPHPGLVGAIHGWAQGRSLDQVLDGTQIAPGDMVRWCKQTIDLLEQIELVSTDAQLAERARSAITAMRRGVVAY